VEKVKAFLFYHGEKVGVAVVVVLCLLGLVVARPFSAAGLQRGALAQDLDSLKTKVSAEAPASEFVHPSLVAQLESQLSPADNVQPFAADVWPTVDIARIPTGRPDFPRLAPVAQVQVIPERGGLKVTWTVDPQQQATENAQARYEGVIGLTQAVIYRATAEVPDQLREVGTVPLDDMVIVPTPGATGRPGPQRFVGGPPSRPQAAGALLTVPEGKISAEDAAQAGRFSYADRVVKAEQDYVYKVKLVAKNPTYDPVNPAGVPEFIESDVPATVLSLAQRPLPSIRWFFMGGNTESASVRVYRWHVFSVPAGGLPAVGSLPSAVPASPVVAAAPAGGAGAPRATSPRGARPSAPPRPPVAAAAPPAAAQPVLTPVGGPMAVGTGAAGAQEMVERGEWVVESFSVGPGDPIGLQVQGYYSPGGVGKPEQLTMDFSTGCTVVAVEMALRISDTPQVTLTAAGAPTSSRLVKDSLLLYYIDPTGALRTRWQEPDLVLAEMIATPAATAGLPAGGTAPSGRAPAARMTQKEYDARMRVLQQQDVERNRQQQQAIQRAMQEDEKHRQERERQPVPEGGGPPGF
jgi:hypothetical protein